MSIGGSLFLCRNIKHITKQIHSDGNKRRFALLFASGDLRRYADMEKAINSRFVAHMDILGMSTLVENNFDDAWGMLSDLVQVQDKARMYEYEFVETNERVKVFENIHIVTFSDTLLLFTAGETSIELKSLVILVTEIFHKAICKCVPIRAIKQHQKHWSKLIAKINDTQDDINGEKNT